ncbi:hypothetical protein M1146_07425 [Patescibacteria group bacterium]|nr:hypothetical protein [Patescibacteria group bacterium]
MPGNGIGGQISEKLGSMATGAIKGIGEETKKTANSAFGQILPGVANQDPQHKQKDNTEELIKKDETKKKEEIPAIEQELKKIAFRDAQSLGVSKTSPNEKKKEEGPEIPEKKELPALTIPGGMMANIGGKLAKSNNLSQTPLSTKLAQTKGETGRQHKG